MRNVKFPVETVRGVPVVAAPWEIDIVSVGELRVALLEAAAHGDGVLVVDLARTCFCDSAGLRALVAAHKRAGAEGGELRLVLPSAAAGRSVFALTGVDREIPSFASLDEALGQRRPPRSTRSRRRLDDDT